MLPCPAARIPWQGCNRAPASGWCRFVGSSPPPPQTGEGQAGPGTGSHGTPVLPPAPLVLATPTVFTLEMFAEGLLRRPFAQC